MRRILGAALFSFLPPQLSFGQSLPVPCGGAACGPAGPATWVTQGSATATVVSQHLRINQQSDSATLNWQSFNVDPDHRVTFEQPSATAVALNRIFQSDPSRIFGALDANGRVYLLNQNGILFGDGAEVNVGGLIASTLDLTEAAIDLGIARAATARAPAFAQFRDASGAALASGNIEIAEGASLTADGGQILIFAPEVSNSGEISTPGGQTILAAGNSIFLATSTDPNLRGLLVEVGVDGGAVTNGAASNASPGVDLVGQIVAERGNVTLAGLIVNQLGRVSATTTVRENGSVRLQARGDASAEPSGTTGANLIPGSAGALTLGERSVTEAILANDDSTTVDVNVQPVSDISMEGARVDILSGARVTATSGQIAVTARSDLNTDPERVTGASDDRIYIAAGAVLDVAGAALELPVERNAVEVELRGNQLRDSPLQQDGALRGETVTVDVRATGLRADGTRWQGTALADGAGEISNVARNVRERNLDGGRLTLASAGDVIVDRDAIVDLSGGWIEYRDGFVKTSQLLRADGRVVDIGDASPDEIYLNVLEGVVREHRRWGVTDVFPGIFGSGSAQFAPGYVEGRDAGSLNVLAPRFAFDGSVRAETRTGPLQRTPSRVDDSLLPFERVPLGAELIFGSAIGADVNGFPTYVTDSIRLAGGYALPTLPGPGGAPFDPLVDLWPESQTASRVRPELVNTDGATRLRLFSNRSIEIPAGVRLDLGAGGELQAVSANVYVAGDVIAPSGSISLKSAPTNAGGVEGELGMLVDTGATFDLRGRWVNDNPLLNPNGERAPLFVSGGTFSISGSAADVTLRPGSSIDVSGGAWRQADGTVVPGAGGSVSFSVAPFDVNRFELNIGSIVAAHSLAEGGKLALTANAICISESDCRDGDPTTFWLSPTVFEANGFSDVALHSNVGGITLTEGTQMVARQRNLEFAGDASRLPTGSNLGAATRISSLPEHLRGPVSLSMSVGASLGLQGLFDNDNFETVGALLLERGSRIDAEPGSHISLISNSRIVIDGTVSTPAGEIDVRLDADSPVAEFLSAQGIWLGNNGRLEAPGAVRLTPDPRGLQIGDVLAGGHISLQADRGFVMTLPGSVIDVAGTAAPLDIRGELGRFARRTVASAGGAVELAAAEAVIVNGSMRAQGGAGDVLGGHLEVTVDSGTRQETLETPPFPLNPREIVVTASESPLTTGPGLPLPGDFYGQARLPAPLVTAAGFDSVELRARNVYSAQAGNTLAANGRIRLEANVDLRPDARLILDAPEIISDGGRARLGAANVALGPTALTDQQVAAPDLIAGSGELVVSADAIELIGHARYQGLDRLQLESGGDLRARGVQLENARTLSGSLETLGDVAITASQIYASTLTDFLIASGDGETGTITTAASGRGPQPVLSAGSSLELRATRIDHGGTLLAPFGQLTLNADEVVLRPGSLSSTSAAGQVIPFGAVQIGTDWIYELPDSQLLVFDGVTDVLPSQQVSIESRALDFQAGAIVDVSGGGELQSYEFIPGVGGSRDVLSPDVDPNTFAIVPSLGLDLAPYDAAEYAGSTLVPGDSVYLAGVDGLPAGRYQLLPARYALLPGAFLVTPVEGYRDIAPTERYAMTDGGTIVAGRVELAGRGATDNRLSGFNVRPGTEAQRRADYEIFRANDFFTARSRLDETLIPLLPNDAGRLSILARGSLALAGLLRGSPGQDGRGAAVEISGDVLRVVTGGAAQSGDGEVLIADSQLNALGASSILIGGSRRQSQAGTLIDVDATSVSVDPGAALSAPEIVLVAADTVAVGAGSTLRAEGADTESEDFELVGDAGFLRLATGAQAGLRRTYADGVPVGATGTLELDSGALLITNGSAILSASRDVVSAANLDIGTALTLGASRITLGDSVAAETPGLVLGGQVLGNLAGLDELVLMSASSIDIASALDLAIGGDLIIDAAGVRMQSADPARLAASEIRLLNSAAAPALAPLPAIGGALELSADRVWLDGGNVQLLGARAVAITGSGGITATEDGSLTVDHELGLATDRLSARAGVDLALDVGGALSLRGVSGTAPGSESEFPDFGAAIRAEADSIRLDTLVELRSGILDFIARGADGITLGDAARVDLRGAITEFDGVAAAASGGRASFTATTGNVAIGAGATVDVSADELGHAGAIEFEAANGAVSIAGRLLAAAHDGFDGGSFTLDAEETGNLDALSRLLGDFRGSVDVRRRAAGSLVLNAGSTLRAARIALAADQGSVIIAGTLDADGDDGGEVAIAAARELRVSGTVNARATDNDGDGGRVSLLAGDGGSLFVDSTALIDVSGGKPGEVSLRAHRDAGLTVTDADSANDRLRLAGEIAGAERMDLEIYTVVVDADGVLTTDETDAQAGSSMFSDLQAFMTSTGAIASGLAASDGPPLRILPGLEIRSAGNLVVQDDWNLFPWRFQADDGTQVPGVLTLRAAGNLVFDGVLSDGFEFVDGAERSLLTSTSESWSYRLAAGADLGSADPLAVVESGDGGNLVVGEGRFFTQPTRAPVANFIRTGTGRIDIAAGRDVVLENAASVIYTSGIASGDPALFPSDTELGGRYYPEAGGDISIRAGRDIAGQRSNQLINAWLWRVGQPDPDDINPLATAWTVNFDWFAQGIGALGGGDIHIASGRDIREVSASIPTIGRQIGGREPDASLLEVIGGGDLVVSAGRDILGGSYYVGRGDAEAIAGRDVGRVTAVTNSAGEVEPVLNSLAPVFALSDGAVRVTARGDVVVEGVVDPMLVAQGRQQAFDNRSHFISYTPAARFEATSVGGDVQLTARTNSVPGTMRGQFTTLAIQGNADPVALRVYPPSVRVAALRGDVFLQDPITLAPAPKGNLELFAFNDLRTNPAGTVQVLLSDAEGSLLPSSARPANSMTDVAALLSSARSTRPGFNAEIPVHSLANQPDGLPDTEPARFVALTGSILFESIGLDNPGVIYLAKPGRFVAGRDIVNLTLRGQNLEPASVTSLIAGRDIVYPLRRTATGALQTNDSELLVAGPGRFELVAGRDIALESSAGIATTGNLTNRVLADSGSDVSITAGIRDVGADYAAFITRYLADDDEYDGLLIAYIEGRTGQTQTKAQALAAFRALERSDQAGLVEAMFFNEVREGGRSAAKSVNSDFTRAFTALETLFPGSNPDVDAGETNPYSGDLSLFFSRVYTLDGGNISLLVPGGALNAGIATPPSAFGVVKAPQDLGVVAQRSGSVRSVSYSDFEVNESRVFSADGDDILVWSTRGDIDAGRGAKTAISAPPPLITFDPDGNAQITFPAALAGSGIRTLASSPGLRPGDVDLFAPRGVVNAGDAGIVAGNLTIAATAVLGADNIQVGGVSVGVPVDTGGLAAGLSGVSAVASSASSAAEETVMASRQQQEGVTPLADAALGFLEVLITGFGDCDPETEDCEQE